MNEKLIRNIAFAAIVALYSYMGFAAYEEHGTKALVRQQTAAQQQREQNQEKSNRDDSDQRRTLYFEVTRQSIKACVEQGGIPFYDTQRVTCQFKPKGM